METLSFAKLIVLLYFSCSLYTESVIATSSSIVFHTLGRADYAFDIFAVALPHSGNAPAEEIVITDGHSVNYNGHFPLVAHSINVKNGSLASLVEAQEKRIDLVYVTERNGSHRVFYDAVHWPSTHSSKADEEFPSRVQVSLLDDETSVSMKDRPTLIGDYLVYVSTHEGPRISRASWAAVYSTELSTGSTNRLTPDGVADFSPAVSPSGTLTAVASYGARGWTGEVEDLSTDIYIFLTRNGTQRVKAVEFGAWPSWVDDQAFFFHRRSDDGWISIFKATLPAQGPVSTESVRVQRVTPSGLHCFTPAAVAGNYQFIALATRRPNSIYRHVELFDLVTGRFTELTRLITPNAHHFNPFVSPDSSLVGYHRCRNSQKDPQLLLENMRSPLASISLFRIYGSYPSFSPGGNRIAYVDFQGMYVVDVNGSNRKEVYQSTAFSTAWDPVRKSVVYTSAGPTFASESTKVDIIAINVDADSDDPERMRQLTIGGQNNGFPSISPDGKWIVFRSGRSGHKNLYVMDAEKGETGSLRRLTEGPWSDTMCNWSPDGDLIAFSSDRENPGSGSFELYLIHPNGTGLKKLFKSGSGGRANHPWFSPDGKSIVFTSDYGGISGEPISNPHHYQPYGDIFTINVDGSNLQRMTHNSYEDGTPTWIPKNLEPVDVEWKIDGSRCSFEDCHWLNGNPSLLSAQ